MSLFLRHDAQHLIIVWFRAGSPVTVTGSKVQRAIWTSDDFADAAEDPLQERLVRLHGGEIRGRQDHTMKVLTTYRAKKEIIGEFGEPVALIEHAAGRRDRRREGQQRRFHSHVRLLMVNCRPAIILPGPDQVELVPSVGAVEA